MKVRYTKLKKSSFVLIGMSVLLLLITIIAARFIHYQVTNATASLLPFTFTAAGDYGASPDTTTVLDGIASSGAQFNLALGDLSYDEITPESAWCDYVKSHVGQTFPFELTAGNHEDYNTASIDGTGGNINNFTPCLPDKIGAVTGTYGKEYYFDYEGLARFITIAPNIQMEDGYWEYTIGNSHYQWLSDAIDSARTAGIRWIVVNMHENCITIGEQGCALGQDAMNLLVDKKVDLVLQGHEHNYQRSKQVASNATTCPMVQAGSYNSSCVVDDGADHGYIKDQGTVFLIVGTGGKPHHTINTSDPEVGYFASWMGANINPTKGFMKFQVSDSELRADFIRTIGGTFSDYFTINNSGVADSPTPTQTPTGTPTPTPLPASGTFQVSPIADVYNDSSTPNTNYGFQLYVKTNGNPVQNTFLRFDLAPLAGKTITNARLGITTTPDTNSGSNTTHSLKLVSSTDWSERYLTYNNTVPISGTMLGSITAPLSNTYYEIPIDKTQIQPKLGSLLSMALTTTNSDDMIIYSRESLIGSPQIILDYTTGVSTPTPTPTSTVTPTLTPTPTSIATNTPTPSPLPGTATLTTIHDTYINSASPNTVYGFDTKLYVDGSPVNKTFIKFDLTSLLGKTFTSVKLRLKTINTTEAATKGTLTIKFVHDDLWKEQYMTYNNTTPVSSTILGSFSNLKANASYDIILDKTFLQQYAGNLISVEIESTNNDNVIFYSRESGTAPQLIVTY